MKDRALIIQALRTFFISRKYLEVETPCRIPAPAPEANIDALQSENWFLQTSPELCMKRLLGNGFSKIFQICKCFRAEERGLRHLTEFTMLEWYKTDINYTQLMIECEELISFTCSKLGLNNSIYIDGKKIDLTPPWPRITIDEAFKHFADITVEEAMARNLFDESMAYKIEPRLPEFGKPIFLMDYPAKLAGLSKQKNDNPNVAERFELYIGNMEIANAFSELTDINEQIKRFKEEIRDRNNHGKTIYPWPEPFIEDLKKMPESAGIALGVDRLTMVLTGKSSIDEVIAFTPENL